MTIIYNIVVIGHRGVAKFGIALGSGPRGHGFKSRHSDHIKGALSGTLLLFTSVFTGGETDACALRM